MKFKTFIQKKKKENKLLFIFLFYFPLIPTLVFNSIMNEFISIGLVLIPNGLACLLSLQIMRNAAETLIPVTLELGGKDAFIVCEDVDIPHVRILSTRCDN